MFSLFLFRTKTRSDLVFLLAVSLAMLSPALHAQVLAPALKQAVTVDAAMASLGVGRAEPASFLLLDLPDVAVAGKYEARIVSEVPGTGWLLLFRGRAGQPAAAPPGQPPQPVLLHAQAFKAGESAQAKVAVDIERSESFTLLAFARGRWFVVERQVKVGVPPEQARAARQIRAHELARIVSPQPAADMRLAPAAASASGAALAEPAQPGAASAPAVAASQGAR